MTSSTARANATSLALDGVVKPLSLRTNCSEEARISSSEAGGLKLYSVLMARHMAQRWFIARSATSTVFFVVVELQRLLGLDIAAGDPDEEGVVAELDRVDVADREDRRLAGSFMKSFCSSTSA